MIKRYKEYRDYFFENVHKKELKFSDDYIKAEWAFEEWLYGQIIDDISDSLIEWQRALKACMTAFVSIKRRTKEKGMREICDAAIKLIKQLPKFPLTHKEQSQ